MRLTGVLTLFASLACVSAYAPIQPSLAIRPAGATSHSPRMEASLRAACFGAKAFSAPTSTLAPRRGSLIVQGLFALASSPLSVRQGGNDGAGGVGAWGTMRPLTSIVGTRRCGGVSLRAGGEQDPQEALLEGEEDGGEAFVEGGEDEEEGGVATWEEDEDIGQDEGDGLTWVERAKALAVEEATRLKLAVVDARWTRGKLLFKVEHENPEEFTVGIEECTMLSRALGLRLDTAEWMEDKAYNLVVSTAGTKELLTREREFLAFKGFPIMITTSAVFKKKTEFPGNLHDVSDEIVKVNQKGRIIDIPREIVLEVRLVQDQTKMNG